MYAVPASAETSGRTEEIIGQWFAKTGNRDKVVLATKAAGPGDYVKHIRGGPRLNQDHLERAVETSLKRLQTDVIDVYQLHWPERTTNYFGRLGYKHREDQDAVRHCRDRGRSEKSGGQRQDSPLGPVQRDRLGHAWPLSARRRTSAWRHRYRSRTPTPCSTAASKWAWRKWRTARTSACWPIHRWRSACSPASTGTASGPPTPA